MIIEWLKFRINPAQRQLFIEEDRQIWTESLKVYAGFIDKQVWLNPLQPNEIILIIRWEDREKWKQISGKELEQIEAKFTQKMKEIEVNYTLIESLEFSRLV
jgi:uncharacterized protein (TIGR03792 family)